MPSRKAAVELGFIRLDGRKKAPLFQQIYEEIRAAILEGRLTANTRLPSSRDLVEQLGVSRTTVVSAIDSLIAEGYLQTEKGRGTFVSKDIPADQMFVQSRTTKQKNGRGENFVSCLSNRGEKFVAEKSGYGYANMIRPFQPGVPALDEFPTEVWAKIVRRVWTDVSPRQLTYGEPAGYFRLRESIAEYLRAHRGVRCETEQVMVVSGTQQAIDIVGRITLDEGDSVLFENPGYVSSRESLARNGARIAPLPVTKDGVQFRDAIRNCRKARLVYVTPSHQYPTGVTMTIERRMEMIEWAGKNGGLIVEDDYDSEYRYAQKPIPAMQGLDSSQRTIYIGSFSKVVFPALSMGYAVVPQKMIGAFEKALSLASRPVSFVDQLILDDFIREGHFGRHLRRMRKTHAQRREVFVDALARHLPDRLQLLGSRAGLHCTALLNRKAADHRIARKLEQIGIVTRPLSAYYMPESENKLNGLALGFACANPTQLRKAIRKSASII